MKSAEIRQAFLDFFKQRDHTIVPSMSLVPGGDQTLLFTNSGMVQFKDVFLGTGKRPYTRVADAQKCMRVAGKHNDLDDVGRDDTHHTFFEMLGNWSFGDYYKDEAISWAWELLTEVWGLPKDRLWATCFEDERGEIPRDDEAAEIWLRQPGFDPDHLLFFGREENFWEMAETGPCGPDSEIHLDRGEEFCDRKDQPGHVCRVNGDCQRFLELWNLVFIQYSRTSPTELHPLPAKHVDTGMGFERIVSVLQNTPSNYRTDLFMPIMDTIMALAGHDEAARDEHFTPYRVIADHGRAASFLIADGVVPGNIGRNYVCRMIIRRASRFGAMIGLDEPFLAQVAETVIEHYGDFYTELRKNRSAILQTISDEERRFHRTIDTGLAHLDEMIASTRVDGQNRIAGEKAFELYATYGLPLEITRDVLREHGMEVDEPGFHEAMEKHRIASGAGEAMGELAAEDTLAYRALLERLTTKGLLPETGVLYDPYGSMAADGEVLALLKDGQEVESASPGEKVALVLPATPFYVEAGGQVSDTGVVSGRNESPWEVRIETVRKPVEGLILHVGEVVEGNPRIGDPARAALDTERRLDIMRNHTATHLLHAALREVLGHHVRQAGSLVAPDRLRFDFTHPEAVTREQLDRIEAWVNHAILANYPLRIEHEPREQAVAEGAMALFGETYGDVVRTVRIGDERTLSFELCGGTHVPETGIIGPFVIVSESSVASGIRRIEALTGRGAMRLIHDRLAVLDKAADLLGAPPEEVAVRLQAILEERLRLEKQLQAATKQSAVAAFERLEPVEIEDIAVLFGHIDGANPEILRELADRFRSGHRKRAVALTTSVDGRPIVVTALSEDLPARGLHAGELARAMAEIMGGGGGGKPTLAQAGGKDPGRLEDALAIVPEWFRSRLQAKGS